MMSDTKPNRMRTLLAATTIGATSWAGAVGSQTATNPSEPAAIKQTEKKEDKISELITLLSTSKDGKKNYAWINDKGEHVNLNALQTASLAEKPVAMAAGFQGCKTFCTKTNEKFKALKEMNADLVYLILNVNPEEDGKEEWTDKDGIKRGREVYRKELMEALGLKEDQKDKLIILYPVKSDQEGKVVKDKNDKPVFDVTPVIEIQNALEFPASSKKPLRHSPMIYLYDKTGKKVAEKSGLKPVEEFKEWEKYLSAEKAKGK
jgi:cytochrome oxidase Cu insertion factor (SCO1/SenC/PrrC family)